MDQQLHWVTNDNDDHAVCGLPAAGRVRSTNPDMVVGEDFCPDCERMWGRYSMRMGAAH